MLRWKGAHFTLCLVTKEFCWPKKKRRCRKWTQHGKKGEGALIVTGSGHRIELHWFLLKACPKRAPAEFCNHFTLKKQCDRGAKTLEKYSH